MLVFRTTVVFGLTNPDSRDFGYMCVLHSINFAQCKPISYISVGRVVIPFLGHFGTAESLTDRRRSAETSASHQVISCKGIAHDPLVNSIALDHIYRLYIASGRTCGESHDRQSQFSEFLWCMLRGGPYISLCARSGIQMGRSCTQGPKL